jgi:hypothetical protein
VVRETTCTIKTLTLATMMMLSRSEERVPSVLLRTLAPMALMLSEQSRLPTMLELAASTLALFGVDSGFLGLLAFGIAAS